MVDQPSSTLRSLSATKITMIECGNSKSFNDNTNLVLKIINKEEWYSHLIPLDEIMCCFSPYCKPVATPLKPW
jgi:hypothetical protein